MVNSNTCVTDFYAGNSVFLTGGTGFVGKVLLEKLLFSCIDIDKIYILVRHKGNTSSEQRVQEIIDRPIFDRIKRVRPNALEKIVPITGDISKINLGLKTSDERLFLDQVSVVFNSAASIIFSQKLDISANMKYESTKRVLDLCHRMKNLKSFVHFSTAYISPQNKNLEEIMYPQAVDPKDLEEFIKRKDMDYNEKVARFLRGRPNTYTLTKALAEYYVFMNHGKIPTTIIRPSIVGSAFEEPIPGWIDSWSASTATLATTTLGYNRVIVGDQANLTDFIPVDYVSNLAIVAAAKNTRDENLEIYNCCTSSCNPISMGDFITKSLDFTVKNGYNDLPIPFAIFTKDEMTDIPVFFLEKLPATIADAWLQVTGKKPRYVKRQNRLSIIREVSKFFTSRSYNLSAERTIALSRSLSDKDAKLFHFNPKDICWNKYIQVYCSGIRRFLLKK